MKRGETLLLACSAATALAPKCPLCYLAILGVTGAAGAALAAWIPLLLIASLLLSVTAVSMRARLERRYAPAVVAMAGAFTIVVGKFVFHSTAGVYAGAAVLFGAAMFDFAFERIRWHKSQTL